MDRYPGNSCRGAAKLVGCVRKDELVLGITTAATLWFSTVVGLCIGGGQTVRREHGALPACEFDGKRRGREPLGATAAGEIRGRTISCEVLLAYSCGKRTP
jgi:hypothetical protein